MIRPRTMRGLWTRFRETGDVVKKPVLRGCPRLQNLLGATVGRCVRNEPPARECRALMPVDYPFRTSLTPPPVSTYYSAPTSADAPSPSFSTAQAPIHPAYLPACHPENIPDELRLELGTPRCVYKPSESSRIQESGSAGNHPFFSPLSFGTLTLPNSQTRRLVPSRLQWHSSRYSVHAGTLQSASGIFCILVLN